MMPVQRLTIGLATAYLFTFFVGFVPTASAQGEVAISIAEDGPPVAGADNPKNGRLLPETSKITYTLKYRIKMQEASSGVAPAVCPLTPITVKFDVVKPKDYANPTLSLTLATTSVGPQKPTSDPVTTVLTIVTTRQAPAFSTDTYKVLVDAFPAGNTGSTGACAIRKADQISTQLPIQNDYLPIIEYTPSKYIQKSGQNKDIVFDIKVTNFSNGATKVTSAVNQPNKNKLDSLLAPSQTTLNSPVDSKTETSKSILVTGRTPHSNGYTNSLYSFGVSFHAIAIQPGTELLFDDQSIDLSVQVQGVYVPGFEPSMAIAGLGLGVLLLGLVRRGRPE